MSKEFKLPDPGEGIREAQVQEIRVSEGDTVKEGDVLLVVETDKADFEVPSSFSGTIENIHVEEGDNARVGDTVATYSEGGKSDGEESDPSDSSDPSDEEEKPKSSDGSDKSDREPEPSDGSDGSDKSDKSDSSPAKEQRGRATSETEGEPPEAPVPASPATRKLAKELGVDLKEIAPSGDGGRVTDEDVRNAAGGEAPEKKKPEPEAEEEEEAPEESGESRRGVREIELTGIRKAVADTMNAAWSEIPHVTHMDTADITELEDFRRGHVSDKGDARPTLSVFLLKAMVAALKAHPRFNARLGEDGKKLIVQEYVHLGVAVDTDDGLVVPVIRDVDCKSPLELAAELETLVKRAREGGLSPEDMEGGCCTLTNVGGLGGEYFTPVIKPPEVAIVGVGEARLERVVLGGLDDPREEIRLRLPLSVSFDHRVNDGADAARFVNTLKRVLEEIDSLILEI